MRSDNSKRGPFEEEDDGGEDDASSPNSDDEDTNEDPETLTESSENDPMDSDSLLFS